MRESGYYPPGAENDPRAPWNETEADSDAAEEAYAKMTKRIGAITGKALYESGTVDVDAMLDYYELAVFDRHDDEIPWDSLSAMAQAIWNALAEIYAYFGHDLVSEDLVEGARQEGDL